MRCHVYAIPARKSLGTGATGPVDKKFVAALLVERSERQCQEAGGQLDDMSNRSI